MKKRHIYAKAAARVIFALYCAVMLWLLLGQRLGKVLIYDGVPYFARLRYNLVPLSTVCEYIKFWQRGLSSVAAVNLIGNILPFAPLGFFLPCIFKRLRKFRRYFAVQVGIILAVELAQLFTLLGAFDIDDIILNTLGAGIGFCLWRAAAKLRTRLMRE